jgi:Flp pilus assembly protein TadD
MGDFSRAEEAFTFVASRLPLTEVYNNLGVVAGRRGKRSEIDYLQKAVKSDPNDPDYRFNLAVALYRAGDSAAAARQLREALTLNPSDTDAKGLLDSIAGNLGRTAEGHATPGARIPAERLKRNYDETSFQQLALEIQNATEMRLSKTDPARHAAYHVERGRELLTQGFTSEAGKEFREAVLLDPANAAAHAGLARVLEDNNDAAGARSEAQSALRLQPSADALLVLARLDVKAHQPQSAEQRVDQALALEPDNATAIALKRSLNQNLSTAPR